MNLFTNKISQSKAGLSLIKMLIIIAIGIVILSYIGFDIKRVIESDQNKQNFGYVKAVVVTIWERYLERPAVYIFNDIFLELIWYPTIDNLKRLKAGEPTNIQMLAPRATP